MPKNSVTPFTYYTFRYDYDDDIIRDKIIAYVKREFPKFALFDEVSEEVKKKHIQGKIGKAMSHEQIRKHFQKEFPNVFCKSNYSIKKIEKPDEYDSYICKDGKPLINNVFDDEYIAEQVKKRDDNKEQYKKKIDKSKSALTFTQKTHIEFKEQYANDYYNIGFNSYAGEGNLTDYELQALQNSKKKLLGFILKRLGNLVKVFDDIVLQRLYNGVKNAIILDYTDTTVRQIDYFESKLVL